MIPFKDNVGPAGVPFLTIALIVLCALVFGSQLIRSGAAESSDVGAVSERDEFAIEHGTSPALIADRELNGGPDRPIWWISPLTAFFVSTDFLHLVINMLFLWIFGRTIELTLGRWRFAGLLVVSAFVGIGAMALADPDSNGLVLGTANVLAAILGAYVVLYRGAAVLSLSLIPLFATLLEVPVLVLIPTWFLLGLVPDFGSVVDPDLLSDTGFQYVGYVGAFAVGALVGLLARGRRIEAPRPMPV